MLARLPSAAAAADDSTCQYRLDLADGRWKLEGGARRSDATGTTAMPVVNGLFSELISEASPGPKVVVTTLPHGVATIWTQTSAWLLATI